MDLGPLVTSPATRPDQLVTWRGRHLVAATRIGFADLAGACRHWRISYLMATSEVRRKYSRSRLGQFWITIAMAITTTALGTVWALLWNAPIHQLLPYVAANLVAWTLLSGCINEATTAFPSYSHYFLNQKLSFAAVVYAVVLKNVIVFAHNVTILLVLILVFQIPVGVGIVQILPALVLTAVMAAMVGYLVALAATRYRDIGQVISNALQVVFFVTPIVWRPSQIPPDKQWLIDFNPFAVFLKLLSAPFLGEPLLAQDWLAATLITVLLLAVAPLLIGRYSARVIYWL